MVEELKMGISSCSCDVERGCVSIQAAGQRRQETIDFIAGFATVVHAGSCECDHRVVLRRAAPIHPMKQLHTRLFTAASKVQDAGPMIPKVIKSHTQASVSPEIHTISAAMKDKKFKSLPEGHHSSSMKHLLQENARALMDRMPSIPNLPKLLSENKLKPVSRAAPSTRRVHQDFQSVRRPSTSDTQNQNRPKYIILPRSSWKIRWDLWIGVVIAYSVVLVPYRIGFAIDLGVRSLMLSLPCLWGSDLMCVRDCQHYEQLVNYGFDVSFAIDVVFNFFTGYYDGDTFIYELPKIRNRYLRSWFVFDVTSTIPFDQFVQVVSTDISSLQSLKLLRTIRLFRLFKLMRLLRLRRTIDTIQMDALNAHVLQTIKSLMIIIFIIHLVSCGWYMFYTWDPEGINWVTTIDVNGVSYPYLVSFYWVANTMMSVGYGDIYGVTDLERLYSIFVSCLGSICVGLIIANIQMLTENYNPRGIKLSQQSQETKEYLVKRGIPRRLRQRVISQFEYHWSRRTVFDENQLLGRFPKSLQYEILAASMEPFVKRFPFFGVVSVDFFVYTIPRLRPVVLGPGQTLVEQESVWEEFYFLVSGSVETLRGNTIVGSLASGDICGIEYLVTERKRYTHTYRSKVKSELYSIYSTDIMKAINKCPIAHRYLLDLATILSARYAESARRGRREIQRQESERRLKLQQTQQSNNRDMEPFMLYRHRKSVSFTNLHIFENDDPRRVQTVAGDENKTHWSIIHHYSRGRILWDVVMAILVAVTAILVPMRIAFDIQNSVTFNYTDRMSDGLFLIDMLLSFFTTYLDETGVEIVDRHDIRKYYLKTTFLIDLLATIPFDFIFESVTSQGKFKSLKIIRTVKLVKLLRLMRLSKLLKMNIQWTSEFAINADSIRLLKLVGPVMIIVHFVGCFWFYISIDYPDDNKWWGSKRIHMDDPDSITSRYIASVYWAATTMTTVGFGDIYAVNHSEKAYCTFVMIGGTTLFAYVIGTVIEVVSNSKSLTNREHEMGQQVNAYIKERGVSNEFILACQEHLRFVNGERTLFNEKSLFDSLCYALRSELILYLNSSVLSKVRFFDKKPKWFLTLVLPRLMPQYFLAGDLLIYHGNYVSGIFFLMSGSVIARVPQQSSQTDPPGAPSTASPTEGTIAMLYDGEFFGYKEILTRTKATYNMFAVKACGTYMLPREFFESIQETYPRVMDEMRILIMNSIIKQQTIVHHWHNNEKIGIFGQERENLLRTPSNRSLYSNMPVPEEGDMKSESYDDRTSTQVEYMDSQLPKRATLTDSFRNILQSEADNTVRPLEIIRQRSVNSRRSFLTNEAPPLSEKDSIGISEKESTNVSEKESATEEGSPVQAIAGSPACFEENQAFHHGPGIRAVSNRQALDESWPPVSTGRPIARPGARRSSVAGFTVRAAQNFSKPVAVKRSPSVPEEVFAASMSDEVIALVERLLLDDGYRTPQYHEREESAFHSPR